MANKNASNTEISLGRNEAARYQRSPEQALAEYATPRCLNNTFYADAKIQLETVRHLCSAAKCALYSRERVYMKDMPALLARARLTG